MNEKEIIDILENNMGIFLGGHPRYKEALINLLDLYKAEKEKNKEIEEEADKVIEKIWNNTKLYIEKDFISKDKIKAEIEEWENVLDFVKTSNDKVAKIQAEILEKIINSLQELIKK